MLTCTPKGTFSLPSADYVDLLRCSPVKSRWDEIKQEDNATSSDTAASPGATFCRWTNGRRMIRDKYCKEAWGGSRSAIIQLQSIQGREYLSHGLWGEVPVWEYPSWWGWGCPPVAIGAVGLAGVVADLGKESNSQFHLSQWAIG